MCLFIVCPLKGKQCLALASAKYLLNKCNMQNLVNFTLSYKGRGVENTFFLSHMINGIEDIFRFLLKIGGKIMNFLNTNTILNFFLIYQMYLKN